MVAPSLRLECTGLTSLVLNPYAGFALQDLDLGDPITRAVTLDAPGANGTIDTTLYHGARTITARFKLVPYGGATKQALRDQLRAFTAPALRPYLYMVLDGLAERRVLLRRSQWSNTMQSPGFAEVVVQWIAPYGIIESGTENSVSAYAAGTTTAGRAYSLTFPRTYPASQALGTATATNAGTVDAYPLIRLYGPCTEPVFDNTTQGKSLTFTGLTLVAGEFLEIDTRTKTIYLQGDSTNSRYNKLSFPISKWWTLSPGANLLRFHPATYTEATTVAVVTWRDAWL